MRRLPPDLAAKGWIDPPGNLARSRVYLFAGKADKVVNPKAVELGASLYRTLGVPASSQTQSASATRISPGIRRAGHSWVTKNFGNACDANASPFINDCDYDQAGDVLQSLYGRLEPPAVRPEGRIVAFDQAEFVPRAAAAANGLSATGYLYVPKACEAGATQPCRMAVVLHGCLQSAEILGAEFYYQDRCQRMGRYQSHHRAVSAGPCHHGCRAVGTERPGAAQHQPERVLELVGLRQ